MVINFLEFLLETIYLNIFFGPPHQAQSSGLPIANNLMVSMAPTFIFSSDASQNDTKELAKILGNVFAIYKYLQ